MRGRISTKPKKDSQSKSNLWKTCTKYFKHLNYAGDVRGSCGTTSLAKGRRSRPFRESSRNLPSPYPYSHWQFRWGQLLWSGGGWWWPHDPAVKLDGEGSVRAIKTVTEKTIISHHLRLTQCPIGNDISIFPGIFLSSVSSIRFINFKSFSKTFEEFLQF